MLKKILKKLKRKEKKKYPNRFLKHYYLHQDKLNKERRGSYSERKKAGICVRCKEKAVPSIIFCKYHQKLQKGYNKKARSEK